MRARIIFDSVTDEKDLRKILMAHRAVLKDGDTPKSCEATDAVNFNGGAVVCVMGAGYDVRTVALSPEQAARLLMNVAYDQEI